MTKLTEKQMGKEKIGDKIEAEESTVEVEPIRERYVKDLADLEAIYEASQAEDPKRTIYPIFRINPYTAGKSIFFCLRNDIPDPDGQDCYGYIFYTPAEISAEGDFEYFIPTAGNPDLDGEIEPDDLIYTGQNFWEGKHALGDPDLDGKTEWEDFTVSIDGHEIAYQVFQAGALDLLTSNEPVQPIVLGAWYFAPQDSNTFPFSNGYKTKEAAIAAANDYELEEAERERRNREENHLDTFLDLT